MHIHARQPGRGWPCRHGQSRAASTPPACGDSGHRAAGAPRPPPAHSTAGHGGSAARPAISPPPVMSPAMCRGPAGAGRGSGVPSGAGRGGCAAARGALGAARAAQTKETRTDTHAHTHTHSPHRDTCPLPSRGAGEPPSLGGRKVPSKLPDCKRQNQRWDETRGPGWWSCSHLASRCSLCRHSSLLAPKEPFLAVL